MIVVLLIAILAAVALPQYATAAAKARSMQAVTALKTLVDAQERYFMANGVYSASVAELDIRPPEAHDFTFVCTARSCKAYPQREGDPLFEFHMQQEVKGSQKIFLGKHWCQVAGLGGSNREKAKKICKLLGRPDMDMYDYGDNYYLLFQ